MIKKKKGARTILCIEVVMYTSRIPGRANKVTIEVNPFFYIFGWKRFFLRSGLTSLIFDIISYQKKLFTDTGEVVAQKRSLVRM